VAITSRPQGADIFINGRQVGTTPLELRGLPVGSRAVRLVLDGHETWSRAVDIVANRRTIVAAALQQTAPSLPYRGSVAITSRPQGADVFINGQRVGTTPLELRNLPVGSRAVRLVLNGHDTWSRAIDVVANQRTTVAAALQETRRR
jgi:hypothetical protein